MDGIRVKGNVDDFLAKTFKEGSVTITKRCEGQRMFADVERLFINGEYQVLYRGSLEYIPLKEEFVVRNVWLYHLVSYYPPNGAKYEFDARGEGLSLWPVIEKGYIPYDDESLFTDTLGDEAAKQRFNWFKELIRVWGKNIPLIMMTYDAPEKMFTYSYFIVDKGKERLEFLYVDTLHRFSVVAWALGPKTDSLKKVIDFLCGIPGFTVEKEGTSTTFVITGCPDDKMMEIVGQILEIFYSA